MNAGQFKRMEELFAAAVDLPPERRHAFLLEACGADTELLLRVERLLRFADDNIGVVGLSEGNRVSADAAKVKQEPISLSLPARRSGPIGS